MTAAQTAERESLYRRILGLPDEDVKLATWYVNGLEGHEPNEETVRAIEESMNPENLTECDSIDDMFKKCGVEC